MKKIIAILFLMVSAVSFADNVSDSTSGAIANSNTSSTSTSGAATATTGATSAGSTASTGASSAGSTLNLDQSAKNSGNVVNHASDLSNMVPGAVAPNLATTLTETCMGSSSVGGSGAGFGFSFGTTWRDSACVRRLDARQLSAFGELAIAKEIMCDSDLVREAAVRAGRACVADGGTPIGAVATAAPVQVQEVPTPEAAAPVVQQIVKE